MDLMSLTNSKKQTKINLVFKIYSSCNLFAVVLNQKKLILININLKFRVYKIINIIS